MSCILSGARGPCGARTYRVGPGLGHCPAVPAGAVHSRDQGYTSLRLLTAGPLLGEQPVSSVHSWRLGLFLLRSCLAAMWCCLWPALHTRLMRVADVPQAGKPRMSGQVCLCARQRRTLSAAAAMRRAGCCTVVGCLHIQHGRLHVRPRRLEAGPVVACSVCLALIPHAEQEICPRGWLMATPGLCQPCMDMAMEMAKHPCASDGCAPRVHLPHLV